MQQECNNNITVASSPIIVHDGAAKEGPVVNLRVSKQNLCARSHARDLENLNLVCLDAVLFLLAKSGIVLLVASFLLPLYCMHTFNKQLASWTNSLHKYVPS